MNDLNSVVLIGRLTRDCELKYTNSGTAINKIGLAVNRKKKSGDDWVDDASFFDVVIWGRQGEALAQYLVKGKQVCVTGTLVQDRWEKEGQKRSRVTIKANDVQLLGGKSENSGQPDRGNQNSESWDPPRKSGEAQGDEPNEEDIPF